MRHIFTDKLTAAGIDTTKAVQLPVALCTLWSVGRLCELLQVPPGILAAAAADLNMPPSAAIDAVPYYEAGQVDQLVAYIQKCANDQQQANDDTAAGDDEADA